MPSSSDTEAKAASSFLIQHLNWSQIPVEHVEEVVLIDIFSPLREDFLTSNGEHLSD
ncbi:MAG TPA: hypothetical protein VLB68_21295 [Pyrinomonadaceae bacterium]|nr:hypothetical protein [Pyrinomonadaceae bacterium]